MNIVGILAPYHGSAARLVQAGELVAAAQEGRFTWKKPTGLQSVIPAVAPESMTNPKGVCLGLIASAARWEGLGALYAEIAALGVISEMRTHCPRGFAPFADRLTDLRGQVAERSHA